LWTDGSADAVDELLLSAHMRTRNEPSIDEFIARVEGTKVYGMDDVLSHDAERRRQAGETFCMRRSFIYFSLLKSMHYTAVV